MYTCTACNQRGCVYSSAAVRVIGKKAAHRGTHTHTNCFRQHLNPPGPRRRHWRASPPVHSGLKLQLILSSHLVTQKVVDSYLCR